MKTHDVTPGTITTASNAGTQWGAAAFSLGAMLFVMGVVFGLRAFGGEWDTSVGSTLPVTAALIDEKWAVFRRIWTGEMIGAFLMCAGAFVLQRMPSRASAGVPLDLVWIVVAIGSLIVAAQYALVLGSYPPALSAFADEPAVFGAIRGGVMVMHAIGSVLQLLGVLVILVSELRLTAADTPDRIVQAAVAVSVVGIALAVTGTMAGELGAAAIFLSASLLGAAIWLRARRSASKDG